MSEARGSRRPQYITWASAAVAGGVLVWALPGTIRFLPEAPSAFWTMALGALLVDVPLFGIGRGGNLRTRSLISVSFTFAIFALWGAAPAVTVQAVAGTLSVVGQRYDRRAGISLVSRLIFALGAVGAVAALANLWPVTSAGTGLDGGDQLALTVLALVWLAVSYGLLAAEWGTVSPRRWLQIDAGERNVLFSTVVTLVVAAALLTTVTSWWQPLLLVVALLWWNLLTRWQLRHEQGLGREPVSGLLNRQGLVGGVQAITAGDVVTPGGPRPFGIILVDFETVLSINRTLGRDLYEKVVATASRRLIEAYDEERAARLSGEGIVILMPDLTAQNAVAETAAAVAVLEPVIEVDDVPFTLDPVGGVSLSPLHGRDLGTLLMKAELAVSEARRTGQRAVLYVRKAAQLTERRVAMIRELHNALRDPARHDEIAVLYQPQVDLGTGRLAAVEGLLRWTHPEWGLVPTDELIEAVEPSEIMHMLTRHVLATVAAQMRRWTEQGDDFRVSVNVSAKDLHEQDFVQELGELVRDYDITPERLVIEITERTLISDMDRISKVAGALAGQGIALSLDDFGTGYASLQQLRELPLAEVKVDRSYVSGMVHNPADAAIVTSVHQLARTLGINVVAEGVEDQRTADALAKLPGTIGQGWHFGHPMTVPDLQEWRRSH